ncbi:MAG: patatin-like phospholipase family protein [Thermoguttaceae bacterium]
MRRIALATILLTGCAATRQYPAPPILPSASLIEKHGSTTANASQFVPPNLAATAAPRNVLVLSGGGVNGAYTAGIIKGWTASGTRPQFDVVTGVSTGALIAPLAFLGPDYDAELERLYTSMRQDNVFRPRLHLLGFDSLVSSDPLAQQIAAGATPEILQKIAEAHHQGRRLYVGTTNLDTKKLVVWDLGAIATRDTPESRTLFQKVLLASCSVPGLLPPVPIDVEIDGKRFTELHVDGGVTACMFLKPAMVGIGPNGEQPSEASPASVYVIVAGKLRQTAVPTKRELFSVAGESMIAVLQAKTEGEATKLFMLARYAGANFKLTGIPQDYEMPQNIMSFSQPTMRGLFDVGYRGGKDGTAWYSFPPELEEERTAMPRSDTCFTTTLGTTLPTSWTPGNLRITLGEETTNTPGSASPLDKLGIERLPLIR